MLVLGRVTPDKCRYCVADSNGAYTVKVSHPPTAHSRFHFGSNRSSFFPPFRTCTAWCQRGNVVGPKQIWGFSKSTPYTFSPLTSTLLNSVCHIKCYPKPNSEWNREWECIIKSSNSEPASMLTASICNSLFVPVQHPNSTYFATRLYFFYLRVIYRVIAVKLILVAKAVKNWRLKRSRPW